MPNWVVNFFAALRPRGARREPSKRRTWSARVEQLELRQYLSFDPSALEQEMLEQVNRMRADPQGELQVLFSSLNPLRATDPHVNTAVESFQVDSATLQSEWTGLTAAPPLAWHGALHAAARIHSAKMIAHDRQAHTLPGEDPFWVRMANEGYPWSGAGENIFAYSQSVTFGHAGLAVDWGLTSTGIQSPAGHRQNIMDPDFQEIGIGIEMEGDLKTRVGPLVITQEFGRRSSYRPQILGAVFRDANDSGSYDAGEGLGSVQIEVRGGGRTFRTSTMTAGGYQLAVPPGRYTVTARSANVTSARATSHVVIDRQNVKVDIRLDGSTFPTPPSWQGRPIGRRDLVTVLQAAKFGTGRVATFAEGDWNGDRLFDQFDLIFVLQYGLIDLHAALAPHGISVNTVCPCTPSSHRGIELDFNFDALGQDAFIESAEREVATMPEGS